MNGRGQEAEREGGFTLVELLVAIIVVGILTAIAIVGIAGLNDKGSTAACIVSKDSAVDATMTYYANTHGQYPQTFADLTSPPSGSPLLDTTGLVETATTLKGKGGWTLNLNPGPTTTDRTTFDGC